MGKLHGLTIGLDICSTLHMDVTLDDLDWCIDRIMPANPAYLMALPTKNDPMLSYLTTAYQDHVRIRETFGYRVDDRMWAFFKTIGVIGVSDEPGPNFGDLRQVYVRYRRAAGDTRPDADVLAEADARIARVRGRGVFLASGHGAKPSDMAPALDAEVRALYEDAKVCIRASLPAGFPATLAPSIAVETRSAGRDDFILHPPTGETLSDASAARVRSRRDARGAQYDVQIVVSDGLNAYALTDPGHLGPYLKELREVLAAAGFRAAPEHIVVTHGRVRAGYRIGEMLFAGRAPDARAGVIHVIGERPGNGHHTFSAYVTGVPCSVWSRPGVVDHNLTRVVSNIADTALDPVLAARQTVSLLAAV
jgi:ethanolamine ammonia-lyase large subunit